MDESDHTPERLLSGSTGLGEVSDELLEKRARELAAMDSRTEPTVTDRQTASEELTRMNTFPSPPEASGGVENITAWDEAPASTGRQAERILPQDEANVGETLVEEGLEEADHEQRLAASEGLSEEADAENPSS